MKAVDTWNLGSASLPAGGLSAGPGDSIYVAGLDERLVQWARGGKAQPVAIRFGEGPARVLDATTDGGTGAYLVVRTASGDDLGAHWTPESGEALALDLDPAPRAVEWATATKSLWYISADMALHSLRDGAHAVMRPGSHSDLVVSADGRRVAVMDAESDDVFVSPTASPKWALAQSNWSGTLAGFAPNGDLLLFAPGLLLKEGEPAVSRVVKAAGSDQPSAVVAQGPYVSARVVGARLILIRQQGDRLVAEAFAAEALAIE